MMDVVRRGPMAVILNNGLSMPRIGLGTYRLKSPQLETVLNEALQVGYRLIDTATSYRNEDAIGRILQEWFSNGRLNRNDVFVTSKLAPSDQGRDRCRAAVEASLEKLGLDYLDMYLIHWPGSAGLQPADPKHSVLRKESWLQLESMQREGKLRSIGISNYMISHVKDLLQHCSVVPAVNQVEFHPHLVQKELLDFCTSKGIHVQAYSSLGAATGCASLLNEPVIQNIAQAHHKTPAQVLLSWGLSHGLSIIPKTSSPERVRENWESGEFSLTSGDIEAIDQLDKDTRYCWDPTHIA